MFSCVQRDPFQYRNPWNIPVEQRLAALADKNRRIAYFYGRPDTSTFRYRVFNMVEALAAAPDLDISASWFTRDEFELVDSFLDRADALVLCRAWYDTAVNQIIVKAKRRGLPVLFDVDDLIFDPDYTHLILETLDQNTEGELVWNHWFGVIGRIGATLKLCDGAIVTNSFLADKVRAFVPRIEPRVLPNFLNRKQQARSQELYLSKRASRFARDEKITIGYFSGTPTHNRDFEIAADAIGRLLDRYERLTLRIVGFLDLPPCVKRHATRVEFVPLQDYLNLQRLIAQTEINIAPLQTNEFTNCKSELKFFEAAIVGTLTVASPTFTFVKAMDHNQNGFLCGANEWENRIAQVIDIVEDVHRYTELAESGYEYAEQNYSWYGFGDAIKTAVFGESASRQSSEKSGVRREARISR